jgi:DNA integrity scanning protein DisA with diadenylate cyclase activity
MDNLTAIDGSVLLDTQGVCHAIGVILDGIAKEQQGDPSRGARFNSAVRYVGSRAARSCVVVVISEDGRVDVIPQGRKS